jgi:hypothetical protein
MKMKLVAVGLILGGIGNLIFLPLHLIRPSEFSTPLAAGASLLGVFSLTAGIGTWTRKIYGWRFGFVTILAATIWCAAASFEMIMRDSKGNSAVVAYAVSGAFLVSSIVFCGFWRDWRGWFDPATKSSREHDSGLNGLQP